MTNADQPAFPIEANGVSFRGLTKREYFAAMAMQGLCANVDLNKYPAKALAEWSIEQADELLRQFKTPKP